MTDTTSELRVLGICGSLRKASINRGLLRAAQELAPEGMQITLFDRLHEIPSYNADIDTPATEPPSVAALRAAIRDASGLLISSPEYNYSVPGVLKNAIDWASRPPSQPFAGKPLAIMGASGGMGGTMRAQYHLRQVAVFLDMHLLNKPEVFVRSAQKLFDADGKLTDEATQKLLAEQLAALATWTKRLRTA